MVYNINCSYYYNIVLGGIMQSLNYIQIQKIEMSATKKLLKYISKEIKGEDVIDNLEFFYPDFGEHKHRLAFNIWISIDFIGKDGKSFIEKLLEEKPSKLTSYEKEVLIERNKSNISLFEIIGIDGEFIKVLDLLENRNYTLYEPDLVSSISTQDVILARVGKLLGHLTFIGDISSLPLSIKPMFLEEIFIDFNHVRLDFPMLTMKQYLKKYSINLYKIYTNCIFEAIEMDEDITSMLYDELDEFEAYLQLKTPSNIVKKHISNLIDFFEYYLAEEDLTLYDLDQIDFDSFLKESIKDGFIVSSEDLNSYISTLKRYLRFLSNKDTGYKNAYKELLDISKSRFDYMNQLKILKPPFVIDRDLSNEVSDFLNEDAISLIMDYDKFILYILDSPLDLTTKNKFIRKDNLLEINNILEFSTYVDKKTPNQKDFPEIHLFYNLSLSLGLLSISDDVLSVTKKGSNYLRLRDEDKYTLFFQYIWSNDFISKITNVTNTTVLEKLKKDLIVLLKSLDENTSYEISTILPTFSNQPRLFFSFYMYLQYLGIIKCNLYPNYEIIKTFLGNKVLEFFESKDKKKDKCSVIQLEAFKKSR